MMMQSIHSLFLNAAILGGLIFAAFPAEAETGPILHAIDGHQRFIDAVNAKDVSAVLAIYDEDAVMVVPGNITVTGKPAIKAYFEQVLQGFEKIELETLFAMEYKDTIVFRSLYTVHYKTAEGQDIAQSSSGIEVARKQADGTWLFIADHHYGGADLAQFEAMNAPPQQN